MDRLPEFHHIFAHLNITIVIDLEDPSFISADLTMRTNGSLHYYKVLRLDRLVQMMKGDVKASAPKLDNLLPVILARALAQYRITLALMLGTIPGLFVAIQSSGLFTIFEPSATSSPVSWRNAGLWRKRKLLEDFGNLKGRVEGLQAKVENHRGH